jgi:propanol-preferring alcohol dehydrogenase
MRAMVLQATGRELVEIEVTKPEVCAGTILVRVGACAVCRTDLHVVDGELPNPKLPLIPGHEIVGRIVAIGPAVDGFTIGERVGIPWLGWTCGECRFCRTGRENLCPRARFTGYTSDGDMRTTHSQMPVFVSGCRPAIRTSPPRRCCAPG